MMPLVAPSTAEPTSEGKAWGALALMFALTIVSMIDRFILALLVKPLRADLGLSNLQLGLLFGTAFALFYGALGLPLARIADRANRVRLVTVAVVLWSACTIASGFASSFWQLLALRAGLALGEAALFPACHSLIHDMFDSRRRARAAAILVAAPPLGGAIAFALGGWLVGAAQGLTAEGGWFGFRAWQLAFLAVGFPGLALGVLFGVVVREPARHARSPMRSDGLLAALDGRKAMFLLLLMAGGLCQVMPYAYQAWGPTLLTDRYGLTIAQAGAALGLVAVAGATLGSMVLPMVVISRYDRGWREAVTVLPLVAVLVGTVVLGLAPLQRQLPVLLAAILVGNFCLLGANSTIIVGMQRLAPDRFRATMVAGILLVSSSLGLGVGPVLVAYLADFTGKPARFDLALSLIAWIAGAFTIISFMAARHRMREVAASAA